MEKRQELLVSTYLDAKEYVIEKGYAWEVDWQARLLFNEIVESQFLAEAAWVILASGFRESIIRRIFPAISDAFLNWENALIIVSNIGQCRVKAYTFLRMRRKSMLYAAWLCAYQMMDSNKSNNRLAKVSSVNYFL